MIRVGCLLLMPSVAMERPPGCRGSRRQGHSHLSEVLVREVFGLAVMVTSTNRVFIVVITCVATCHAKFAAVGQVIVATRLFPLPSMGISGVGVDTAPVEI